ncbi:MAG: hypothetical protein M3032_04880, partial [Verrucomicrobiota bacterium]|nr:hypothetical protein [Verrucomicrobiota bacterium]
MKNPHHCFRRLFHSLASVAVPLLSGALSAATPLDTNLIVNGDAEASPGASNYSVAAPPVGWTTTSNFSVVRYDATSSDANAMKPAVSAKFGGGVNFFAGGPNNADSSATQTID